MKEKTMGCWAVLVADPKSDEPGYRAYVSLYAKKDAALAALRNSANEDAAAIDGEVRWHDEDTNAPWCEVCYASGEVRWTETLEYKKIINN